jgi:hypothetical protein
VFFRNPTDYLTASPADAARRTFIGVFVCCVLRYYEYALDLVDHAEQEGLLASEDCLMLREFVKRTSAAPRSVLKDVRRLAERVVQRLRHPRD